LPTFLALIIISRYYDQFRQNRNIQIFLKGIRPIVIGLLFFAAYTICPITKQINNLNMLLALKIFILFCLGYILLNKSKINSFGYFFLFGLLGVFLF
jgi:chromate transporter